MSSSVNILRNMVSFDKAEQFDGYSKVIIIVSDEIEYSAGTGTGRTLTLNCPWGTQEIANNILQSIKGFQYQPMTAENALVDPSVEIGDGISANGVYSGVYSLETKFNSNLPTSVSAPADEEIDEEFPYKSSQERKVDRQNREIRASLSIQADRITQEVYERKAQSEELRATMNVQAQNIEAKVSKEGGDDASDFWWKLLSTGWDAGTGGKTVFSVKTGGAYVDGEIRATRGKIGGFDIQSNYLSYNSQTWGGTNRTGIYVGTNGIQCGANSYWRNDGYFKAVHGEFTGSVNAGSIRAGGDYGTLDGSGLSDYSIDGGKVAGSTLGTRVMSGGVTTSLGYADRFNSATEGDAVTSWYASYLYTAYLYVNGDRYKPTWIYYTNSAGKSSQMKVLAYSA